MTDSQTEMTLLEKLHSETAQISWSELQRFFAQGVVMNVEPDLDLVEVAMLFAQDESSELGNLLESNKVGEPSNDLARDWFKRKTILWSVVVAPFVLVQERN